MTTMTPGIARGAVGLGGVTGELRSRVTAGLAVAVLVMAMDGVLTRAEGLGLLLQRIELRVHGNPLE